MLTNQDIQKIIKANEQVFATKEDLENFKDEMKENFSNLLTSVDSYAKKADSFFQEMVMLSHKVDRQEKWIHELAEKMSVQLKY